MDGGGCIHLYSDAKTDTTAVSDFILAAIAYYMLYVIIFRFENDAKQYLIFVSCM